jgi:hypothetical protein
MLIIWLLIISLVYSSSDCKSKPLRSSCDPECLEQNIKGFTCACDGPNILCYPSNNEPSIPFGLELCMISNAFVVEACIMLRYGYDYLVYGVNLVIQFALVLLHTLGYYISKLPVF